jgi:DNA-binding response OmpR family regulator
LNILLVEDDEHVRNAHLRLIKRRGHNACWAATAGGAIKLLMTEPIDIVLLDINLGEDRLSGRDVIRFMKSKANLQLTDIHVIVLSATDHQHLTEEWRADPLEEVENFLVKPLIGQELKRFYRILEIIESKKKIRDSQP